MKKGKLGKALLLSLLSLGTLSLGSCSSFIEQEAAVGIAGISARTLDDGNTEITITYTDEEQDPSVFVVNKGNDGSAGNGIKSITYNENEDGSISVTISFTNKGYEDQTFYIPAANSISEVISELDEETGNTTVTIHYSDSEKEDTVFIIPPGKDGEQGVGIANITYDTSDNGDVIMHIHLTDGSDPIDVTLKAANGIKAMAATTDENGDYKITVEYTNGTKDEFTLDGPNSWLGGNGTPEDSLGKVGDYYLDELHGTVYKKTGNEESSSWVKVIDLKEDEVQVTVTFSLNDSLDAPAKISNDITSYFLPKGSNFYSLNRSLPTATRFNKVTDTYYTFDGWWAGTDFSDVNVGQFTNLTNVYGDITLYAKWSE